MKPHASRGQRLPAPRYAPGFVDDEAITPILGSIMILGMSVLGISAILVWGAPAVQIIQEQNAHAAMLGEFHDIRQNSLVLTITDSSRLPRINLNAGEFSVEQGTRMAITSMFATAPLGCSLDVRDWSSGNDQTAAVDLDGCLSTLVDSDTLGCPASSELMCLRAYTVDGRSITQVKATATDATGGTGTLTVAMPQVIAEGSWVIRLENKAGTVVYAETWVIDQQAIHWTMAGRSAPVARYEGGAVFSGWQESLFIEKAPPIAEQAFGTDELALRLPFLEGPTASRSGLQSIVLFMRLDDNILRVDDDVRSVQYDFEGRFAQAWCSSLDHRNDDLSGGFAYRQPYPTRACTGSTHEDGRYTVVFDRDAGITAFPFAFTHVQISVET